MAGTPATGTARKVRKRKVRSLSESELDRLKNKLLILTPSEPWTHHLYQLILAGDVIYKTQQSRELERVFVWPPGGRDATLMRHCRKCGPAKWVPPQYLNAGLCADCREALRAPPDPSEHQRSTVSASAAAMAAAEDQGATIVEMKLEREDTPYLIQYIEKYLSGQKTRDIKLIAPGT